MSIIRTRIRAGIVLLAALALPVAADRQTFEISVQGALDRFYAEVPASKELGARAVGMLIFPRVYKAGFGVGVAAGDGALKVNGETVQYYRTTSASIGFQIGVQGRTEVVLFMNQEALDRFRASRNWQAGIDGSIAVVQFGVGKSIDTDNLRDPILGFIFDNKGLMYDLSFKGAKYWKIEKQ
jgi:lipid-binding SYLF domain-containing protein